MEIRKSKETLVLTQIEKIILSKAYDILDEIFEECDYSSDFSDLAGNAKTNIGILLDDAEVEEGEPKGEITISVLM